jgi:putative endonuclease
MALAKRQYMIWGLKLKTTNHQAGLDAEEICAQQLEKGGYKILEKRFKCKAGEIDIIAQKNKLVAFLEVKRRKAALLDDPIGPKQKRRIANAALQYIYENPEIAEHEMRFDFIFVDSVGQVHHTEAAWIMEN